MREAQAAYSEEARRVAAIEETARTYRTASGEGEMLWRTWGDGAPLLLLHGGSGSCTHWIRNTPTLARTYQLWVPDLPGLGDSAMPPLPWTPASVAAAVTDGLCTLVARDASLSIAGFSFGGHVAGLAAARLAPGVRALFTKDKLDQARRAAGAPRDAGAQ